MIPPSFGAPYAFNYPVDGLLGELRTAAGDALAEAAAELDIPATTTVIDGPAGHALERLSRSVDVVVTGSRGWGPARRVILGSATSHLTRHAACPVIVVPTTAGATGDTPLVEVGATP
jgi:nucleotide-binding universal stress UspA family protein